MLDYNYYNYERCDSCDVCDHHEKKEKEAKIKKTEKEDKCTKCDECINDPGRVYCNINCTDTSKNCYESHKVFNPGFYAKAYVNLQVYENLFNIDNAFKAGTIFKDLYSPYCDKKLLGGKKND